MPDLTVRDGHRFFRSCSVQPVSYTHLKADPDSAEIFEKVENVNGYLNFYVSDKAVLQDLLAMDKEDFGSSEVGKGKRCV